MLKNILMIGALAFCGVMGVQATEIEENEKDLTPGVLVCNEEESKCFTNDEQEESPSSALFSLFCEDDEEEIQLLACKDCR
jgi:hypothetical protein